MECLARENIGKKDEREGQRGEHSYIHGINILLLGITKIQYCQVLLIYYCLILLPTQIKNYLDSDEYTYTYYVLMQSGFEFTGYLPVIDLYITRRKWSQNERMVNREVKKRQEQPSNKKTEKKRLEKD